MYDCLVGMYVCELCVRLVPMLATRVRDGCEPPCWYSELNLGPQKQQELLTAKPCSSPNLNLMELKMHN